MKNKICPCGRYKVIYIQADYCARCLMETAPIKKNKTFSQRFDKKFVDCQESHHLGWGIKNGSEEVIKSFIKKEVDSILERLVLEKVKAPRKHAGKSFCPQCEDTGYIVATDDLEKIKAEIKDDYL